MKTRSLLLLSVFFLLTTVLNLTTPAAQEVQEFDRGYIDLVEVTNYTFEMKVTGQSKYSLNLKSDAVMKQTTIKISPTYENGNIYYDNFKFEESLPARLDETVFLNIEMDDFYEYGGSFWFKETNVEMREKFTPKFTVVSAISNLAKAKNVNDKGHVESITKQHLYLAYKYTVLNPYSNRIVNSLINDDVYETSVSNNEDLSQNVSVKFENSSIFAKKMQFNETRTKYLDGFYIYDAHEFVNEFVKGAEKQKKVSYAYFLFNLINIFPLDIATNLQDFESEYKFEIEKNEGGSKGFDCVKKSSERYTCQFTYKLTSLILFPNSKEIDKFHYPYFITSDLVKNGMTDEQFEVESKAIDLGTGIEN